MKVTFVAMVIVLLSLLAVPTLVRAEPQVKVTIKKQEAPATQPAEMPAEEPAEDPSEMPEAEAPTITATATWGDLLRARGYDNGQVKLFLAGPTDEEDAEIPTAWVQAPGPGVRANSYHEAPVASLVLFASYQEKDGKRWPARLISIDATGRVLVRNVAQRQSKNWRFGWIPAVRSTNKPVVLSPGTTIKSSETGKDANGQFTTFRLLDAEGKEVEQPLILREVYNRQARVYELLADG